MAIMLQNIKISPKEYVNDVTNIHIYVTGPLMHWHRFVIVKNFEKKS